MLIPISTSYFVDDQDCIRSLENPRRGFHFWISKNERVLEVHREAMNTCIRNVLAPRFDAIGLQVTRLPVTAGPFDPHIPILASRNLATASRILIFAGGIQQDLGVLAYRLLGNSPLSEGSLLDFVRTATTAVPDTAIVAANVGQLVWHRRGHRAMTVATWNALPRATGVDGPMRKDPIQNSVEGHRSTEEHIASVMAFVQTKIRGRDVAIDIVGVEEGAELLPRYLDANWDTWKGNVRAICIGLGFVWHTEYDFGNEEFRAFWGKVRFQLIPLCTLIPKSPDCGQENNMRKT